MIWVVLWCTGLIVFRAPTGFNLNIWETRGIGKLNGMAKNTKLVSDRVCAVLSCVPLFVTPWTCHQAPLSTGILQARILEWVAVPSSRGSSQPRDRTQVSCTAVGFFTIWATREAQETPFRARQSGFRDLSLDHWLGRIALTRVRDSCCPRQVTSSVWWRWLYQIIEGLRVTLKNLDLIR